MFNRRVFQIAVLSFFFSAALQAANDFDLSQAANDFDLSQKTHCLDALTQARATSQDLHQEALDLAIQQTIARRTGPLHEMPPRPYIYGADGQPISIQNALSNQFIANVMTSSLGQAQQLLQDMMTDWVKAYTDFTLARAKQYTEGVMAQYNPLIEERMRSRHEESKKGLSEDQLPEKLFISSFIPYEGIFPKIAEIFPFIMRHGQLARSIYGRVLQDRENISAKTRNTKPQVFTEENIPHTPVTLPSAMDVESRVAQTLLKDLEKESKDRLRALHKEVGSQIDTRMRNLAPHRDGQIPHWDLVLRQDFNDVVRKWREGVEHVLTDLHNTLRRQFPLPHDTRLPTRFKISVAQLPQVLQQKIEDIQNFNEIITASTGLHLKDIHMDVNFDAELGTSLLISDRRMTETTVGPVVHLWHGEGTPKSVAASWRTLFEFFIQQGFNPVAMDLPMAGLGMNIEGYLPTTEYLDLISRRLQQRFSSIQVQNENLTLPHVVIGRSMGAAKTLGHALMHRGLSSPFDVYGAMSFSNPATMSMQTSNVYQQLRNGTISAVIDQALNNASLYDHEMQVAFEQILSQNPTSLQTFGNQLLFWQGDSDEDGGPTVIDDLRRWQSRYSPAAHVMIFENPLKSHPLFVGGKVDPALFEGTHFLLSNMSDMTAEEGEKHFPGVDPGLLPQLRSQTFEVMSSYYAFFDYLIEGLGQNIEWPLPEERRAQTRLLNLRRVMARDEKGQPMNSFFEWYLSKLRKTLKNPQLTIENIRATPAGRQSMAARLRRTSLDYWEQERIRIRELYRTHGLISHD